MDEKDQEYYKIGEIVNPLPCTFQSVPLVIETVA